MVNKRDRTHFLSFVTSLALLAVSWLCISTVRDMAFSKAEVINTNRADYFTESLPARASAFVRQDPGSVNLRQMRAELERDLAPVLAHTDELTVLVAVRHWCRSQQGAFSEQKWRGDSEAHENPLKALAEQREGKPGARRRFAYILTGALTSLGFDARLVHFAPDFSDATFNHTLVEVWSLSVGKWLLIDSDYDTFYLVDGQPASLLELYTVVKEGSYERLGFERNGSTFLPEPRVYENQGNTKDLGTLLRSVRHIYFAKTNAFFDGYGVGFFLGKRIDFTHYSDPPYAPDYPGWKKGSLLFMAIVSSVAGIGIQAWLGRKTLKTLASRRRKQGAIRSLDR